MILESWKKQIRSLNKALEHYNLARSALYLVESWPLTLLNRAFTGKWGEDFLPPKDFQEAAMKAGQELLIEDAKRASEGLFPLSLLAPQSPLRHAKSLIDVWADGVRVAWRMKQRSHTEFSEKAREELSHAPSYYQRNFHFQTDGYLSEESAKRYDHQVEILFKGAASAMRRLALIPLSELKNKPSQILELGSGTGSATRQVTMTLPQAQITSLDLSGPYLSFARRDPLLGSAVSFVKADAAETPFKDESFDAIFSVFLFHELPMDQRIRVLHEAYRVLKPGGRLVIVDSIQRDDLPQLNWGIERFPKDFHEPFYTDYTKNPLEDLIRDAGFKLDHKECKLFAKCLGAQKPLKANPARGSKSRSARTSVRGPRPGAKKPRSH